MTSSDMLRALENRCREAGTTDPMARDTDATSSELTELAALPLVGVVQADLAARGLVFQLVPASWNPNPDDPTTIEGWVDAGDQAVRVGVPAGADVGEVGLVAARMLAEIHLGAGPVEEAVFPRHLTGDRDQDLAADAVMISFAVKLCARHGLEQPLARKLKALGRNIELKAVRGGMNDRATVEAAVMLWAYLTAVAKPQDRAAVLGQVERVAPETTMIAKRLLARMKSPQTQRKAAEAVKLIVATLRQPRSLGHAPDQGQIDRARAKAERERSERS